jgi:hypothetical protein
MILNQMGDINMRTLLLAAAAVVMIAGPAGAQGVTVDGPGIGVHVGPGGVRVGPDRWHRHHWREREVRGDCRTVTVRDHRPDGSVVTRTRSRC